MNIQLHRQLAYLTQIYKTEMRDHFIQIILMDFEFSQFKSLKSVLYILKLFKKQISILIKILITIHNFVIYSINM